MIGRAASNCRDCLSVHGWQGEESSLDSNRLVIVQMLRVAVFLAASTSVLSAQSSSEAAMSGRELYVAACANCHGADGRGATKSEVGFPDPLPDFNDCSYASRENAQDWFAVAHQGGPVRSFSQRMPAFGAALSTEQIERVVAYVRSFCKDKSWPRGELNLPRALTIEKAFPEDETVVTMNSSSNQGVRQLGTRIIHEKRFGSQNQLELVIPIGWQRTTNGNRHSWSGAQLGDVSIAYKRALLHDGDRGYILSGGLEATLPSGDTASRAGQWQYGHRNIRARRTCTAFELLRAVAQRLRNARHW